ncbi:MAG TPA: hypothetical protein VFZ53_18665, partial [Polyangiaceae bacterium]
MKRRTFFVHARPKALAVGLFSTTSVACSLGTYSLGVGPERDDLQTNGGTSGSANGGAMPASGGSNGNAGAGGTSGTDGTGASATGGSTGVTFGVLGRLSGSTAEGIGNGKSYEASLSADGRFVVYTTESTNFFYMDTNGVPDVLVQD